MNDVPDKLHLPKTQVCENKHQLLKDGKPTRNVAWDHEGNPECLSCFVNHRSHANSVKGECSQGHSVKPGDVSFHWNEGKVEVKCPKCK